MPVSLKSDVHDNTTVEAIINSLPAAETIKGKKGRQVEALPQDKGKAIFSKYNRG